MEFDLECGQCDYQAIKEALTDSQLFAFEFYGREKAFPGAHLQVWDYNLTESEARELRKNLMLIDGKVKQLEVEAATDGQRT